MSAGAVGDFLKPLQELGVVLDQATDLDLGDVGPSTRFRRCECESVKAKRAATANRTAATRQNVSLRRSCLRSAIAIWSIKSPSLQGNNSIGTKIGTVFAKHDA